MKYKKIYSIEVLNDYFPEGKGGNYRFVPTESCKRLLQQTGAFYKVWGNMLYVVTRIDKDGKPVREIPVNSVFEFYIEPLDSSFFIYTVADLKESKRYFFHNAAPSALNGLKHLYGLPAAFNGTKAYNLSDTVLGPGNELFEALRNLGAGSSLADGTAWANRGQKAYVSAESLMPFYGSFTTLPVTPVSKKVEIRKFKVYPGNVIPPVLLSEETIFYDSEVSSQHVTLEGLREGLYEIRINNISHIAYIDPANTWQSLPALSAIGNYGHLSAAFALLDNNGALLSPEYTVRFAPRPVLWQLKYRGSQLPANAEPNGSPQSVTFARPGLQPNVFLSSLPVRFQQSAYKNGILLLNNNDPPDQVKVNHLPAPATTGLEMLRQNNTDYFLTTTNLYS